MAVNLTGASTQYLRNSAPVLIDYPFTVAMWARLHAAGAASQTFFSLTDTGTTNNYIKFNISAGELLQQSSAAGATSSTQTAAAGTQVGPNDWTFIVFRGASSTERRTSIMQMLEATTIHHLSTTAARAPTGMDTMLIGAHETSAGIEETWDGDIAEFWLAKGDVGTSGANLTNTEVMQLAFGGPFSIPRLSSTLMDYRSFFGSTDSRTDKIGEVDRTGKRSVWTAVNGPLQIASHPPLPYWYQRRGQVMRPLVI